MANVPFTALPNLNPPGPATIVPVVASGVNYTVTMANLQTYVNSTTGNIQGNYILGNGSQLTGLPATYSDANVVTLMAAFGSNTISTTGNITGSYILGNGSQLTGLPATYGNANVTTLLAAFGSNTISTTGNITGGNINGIVAVATYATSAGTATVATTANSVAGANVTGTVANATYATSAGTATTATSAGTAATVTTAAQPNITSVGTLTVVNTSGNVSATGNVQGSYILGNGSQLTGIATSSYGNANVATFMAAFGSNAVSTTGNVSASYYTGNGSLLTGITASGGTSIVNGNSNVSISSANGNISFVTTGNTVMQIVANRNYPYVGIVSNVAMEIPSLYCFNDITNPGSSTVIITGAGAGNVTSGTVSADIMGISPGGRLQLPINTAAQTRLVTTGSIAGQIRAVSDSPTVHGRLCFWDSTNSRWSYVSDNTAV